MKNFNMIRNSTHICDLNQFVIIITTSQYCISHAVDSRLLISTTVQDHSMSDGSREAADTLKSRSKIESPESAQQRNSIRIRTYIFADEIMVRRRFKDCFSRICSSNTLRTSHMQGRSKNEDNRASKYQNGSLRFEMHRPFHFTQIYMCASYLARGRSTTTQNAGKTGRFPTLGKRCLCLVN